MILEIIGIGLGVIGIIIGIFIAAKYAKKSNLLQNAFLATVLPIVEKLLNGIVTESPQLEQVYVVLVDAINAVILSATPGTSEAVIEAQILKTVQDTLAVDDIIIDPAVLANLISVVMIVINALTNNGADLSKLDELKASADTLRK
jgi:hypothetical protein